MMLKHCRLTGEDGSVLVLALIILVVLTMLGIAANMTTEIETRIAANENIYKVNLYRAESAAMAGVQMLENETDVTSLKNLSFHWLHPSLPDSHISSEKNWDLKEVKSNQAIDENNRYIAVYRGVAPGGSLDMGSSPTSLYEFTVFGRSSLANGEAIVEVGYRRRF
jgi:hypothetical protein